jgi:hypothetical protein
MDSIDITDMAFSLASIPDVNEVISSATEAVENIDLTSDSNTNLFFIIGFFIIISGLFLYNYYINKNKKVSFSGELQEQYYSDEHN